MLTMAEINLDLRKMFPLQGSFVRRLFITCGVFTRYFFVAFSWFFRGFFVALFCLEKQCLGLFRGFFAVFLWLFRGFFVAPVLGKIYRVLALKQSSEFGLGSPPPPKVRVTDRKSELLESEKSAQSFPA